ncbi:hypothetical protein IHE44_0010619 [Lamprotornis superbus]|uniref:Large ribosomal subunit protein uL24 C-terminal domain-containing protein n=1 Tax=Lamprotornis superbus TaxID=245042 RepID=A0A835NJ21_9PASS|nr:hypothetical protein IHE44_0010619 [Lamprotornis superbus]
MRVPSTMRLSALLSAARPRLPPGYRHGMWPPDSMAARLRNPPGQRRRKVFVEPIAKDDWKVFKGDTVRLLLPRLPPAWQLGCGGPTSAPLSTAGPGAGREGRGEAGNGHPGRAGGGCGEPVASPAYSVTPVPLQHYRYVNRTAKYSGTYIASEAPLLLNQISLVDPEDRKPTEVEWRYTEEGERVRVSLRSGRILPVPPQPHKDGIVPEQWTGEWNGSTGWGDVAGDTEGHCCPLTHADGPKDTSEEDALAKTYRPSLKTFEEEIMDAMGIVETRRAKKSYWY